MANNETELMRNYMKVLESGPIYIDELDVLEEGPRWQAFKNVVKSAFSRAFGQRLNEPKIQRALFVYVRGFEAVMKQYRQTYGTLTWGTVLQFLMRSRTAQALRIPTNEGDIPGQTLTRDDIQDIFKDDRQLLAKILQNSRVAPSNPIRLIPQAGNIFSSTTMQSIVGGPDPNTAAKIAEVIAAAVLEAAIVTMIEKHEGSPSTIAEPEPVSGAPAAGGAPAARAAGGAPAGARTPAPAPTPAPSAQPTAAPRITPQQAAALRNILGIS